MPSDEEEEGQWLEEEENVRRTSRREAEKGRPEIERELARRYRGPGAAQTPAGYAGAPARLRKWDGDEKETQAWLSKQESYALPRVPRKRHGFRGRQTVAHTVDEQWQADLADMRVQKRRNRGYAYILTVIDVLSRYAWARPLKKKDSASVADAFEDIFRRVQQEHQHHVLPQKVQTDRGREFTGQPFQRLLTCHGIVWFASGNPHIKCALAERFNRTLKSRLYRRQRDAETAAGGGRRQGWLDDLAPALQAYNAAPHRVLPKGMSPSQVTPANQTRVARQLFGERGINRDWRYIEPERGELKLRQTVRTLAAKPPGHKFAGTREGADRWGREIYYIVQKTRGREMGDGSDRPGASVTLYTLRDTATGQLLKGRRYKHELQTYGRPPT